MSRYTDEMQIMVNDLTKQYGNDLSSKGISLNSLNAAILNYSMAATKFHQRLNKIDKTQ